VMNRLCLWLILVLLCGNAQAKLIGKKVEYQVDADTMRGYLVYDSRFKGKRPGILVVHEWWGQNNYVQNRARMLAKLGYVAFALDMYGKGKLARQPKLASRFSAELLDNPALTTRRFTAAYDLLKHHPRTEASSIAAIGYGFGGGVVLEMMRQGLELKAVVSVHGSLTTQHPVRKAPPIKTRVLVLNGGADQYTTARQVLDFKEEMAQAGVEYHLINYPGAMHAFSNPAATKLGRKFRLPLAYHKEADRASWQDTRSFLKNVFK